MKLPIKGEHIAVTVLALILIVAIGGLFYYSNFTSQFKSLTNDEPHSWESWDKNEPAQTNTISKIDQMKNRASTKALLEEKNIQLKRIWCKSYCGNLTYSYSTTKDTCTCN